MKCKHILMFPVVLTSANITSSLYYLLVNLKCCFQTNPCLELSISRQPRFHYSIKLSSSKKLNSSSSKCLGGNLISYCACASARTSGRLSFSRFFSQDNCSFLNIGFHKNSPAILVFTLYAGELYTILSNIYCSSSCCAACCC